MASEIYMYIEEVNNHSIIHVSRGISYYLIDDPIGLVEPRVAAVGFVASIEDRDKIITITNETLDGYRYCIDSTGIVRILIAGTVVRVLKDGIEIDRIVQLILNTLTKSFMDECAKNI